MGRAQDVFVIPDAHVPHHDRRAWKATLKLLGEFAPRNGVILGDFADCESLSHHPRNNPEIAKLAEEMLAVNYALDDLQAASRNTRWVYLEGNHEYRAVKYVNVTVPNLDGVLDVPALLGLAKRRIQWLPFRRYLRRSWASPWGVGYMHSAQGNGKAGSGRHHAAYHAQNVGPFSRCPVIVYGHHHTFQSYRSPAGFEAHCGGFLGCFDQDDRAFDYDLGPTPWVNGVLVQNVCGKTVSTMQVPIVNGKISLLSR